MIYVIRKGTLSTDEGVLMGTGGSGLGENWNVPGNLDCKSPIPADCVWKLLKVYNEQPDPASWDPAKAHLGHFAIQLQLVSGTPADQNGNPRKFGFYMHGFSATDMEAIAVLTPESTPAQIAAAHTSSLGCIEMPYWVRLSAWRLAQMGQNLRTV